MSPADAPIRSIRFICSRMRLFQRKRHRPGSRALGAWAAVPHQFRCAALPYLTITAAASPGRADAADLDRGALHADQLLGALSQHMNPIAWNETPDFACKRVKQPFIAAQGGVVNNPAARSLSIRSTNTSSFSSKTSEFTPCRLDQALCSARGTDFDGLPCRSSELRTGCAGQGQPIPLRAGQLSAGQLCVRHQRPVSRSVKTRHPVSVSKSSRPTHQCRDNRVSKRAQTRTNSSDTSSTR